MKGFRKQLLLSIQAENWELSEIIAGKQWWEIEHWSVISSRKPAQIWLGFISHDGEQFQASVDEVRATTQKLNSRIGNELIIASLEMKKGNFNEKLESFVHELNSFRNSTNHNPLAD